MTTAQAQVEQPMARRKPPKPITVNITDAAAQAARIAAGYTGETFPDYVSRVLEEKAKADIDRLHREKFGPKPKGKGGES
jgi:hypothetical protein